MKILLFGVSNVGKTTIGKLLAEKLGFTFWDLDEEVKKFLGVSLEEFVHTGDLRWRDQLRGKIIKRIINSEENLVAAITPISYSDNFKNRIAADDILSIELYDTIENIFSRLVFSDENDNVYVDNVYKNAHKNYYMEEIQADLEWYGEVNAKIGIKNRVFINNDSLEKVTDRIIEEFLNV